MVESRDRQLKVASAEIVLRPENLREKFQQIIRQYRETGENVILDQGSIGDLNQEFFCRHNYDHTLPPNTGIALTRADGARMEYRIDFFIGQPEAYGKIIVGESRLEAHGKGKGLSVDGSFLGVQIAQLVDIYDDVIVQVAAEVYGISILHPINVDVLDNKLWVERLAKRGYKQRMGRWDTMDRIFTPQVNQNTEDGQP